MTDRPLTAVEQGVSLTAADIAALDALSPADLEREILKLRSVNPRELTEAQVERAVVIHRIATRKTSGPARAKAKVSTVSVSAADLDKELGLDL